MSLFRRLTIRTKLVSSFSVLTLLLALIAGYGYYEMGAIGGEVQHVIQRPDCGVQCSLEGWNTPSKASLPGSTSTS